MLDCIDSDGRVHSLADISGGGGAMGLSHNDREGRASPLAPLPDNEPSVVLSRANALGESGPPAGIDTTRDDSRKIS